MTVTDLDYDNPFDVAVFFVNRFDVPQTVAYSDDPEEWEVTIVKNKVVVEVGYNSLNEWSGVEWAVRDPFDGEVLAAGGWREDEKDSDKARSLLRAVSAIRDII